MASLANQTISSTYDGLVKTSTDQPVPISGVQLLEDGVGNSLALSVGRANQGVTVTGTLTATALSGPLTGNVTGNLTGTVLTAAQPNITSVGTLSSLNVTGNVGIGVTPSGAKFHIVSTNSTAKFESSTTGLFNTYKNSNGDFAYVGTGSQTILGGSANDLGIQAVNNFVIATGGNTESMRIDASGNVGIGGSTVNIAGFTSLAIDNASNGSFFDLRNSGADSLRLLALSTSDQRIQAQGVLGIYTAGSERMRIDSSGNVLIGSTGSGLSSAGRGVLEINGASSSILGLKVGGTVKTYLFQNGDDVELNNTANGFLALKTNAQERMRIDSAGNVGIGTSSPSTKLHLADTSDSIIRIQRTGVHELQLNSDGTVTAASTDLKLVSTGNIYLTASGSERMRITAAGDVWINESNSVGKLTIGGSIGCYGTATRSGFNGSYGGNTYIINWTGSAAQLYIDNTNLGTIQISSDYRIKRNIETQTTPALSRINQLRPVTYQKADYGDLFKADDELREGFIAHELAEIIPSAVEGEKDAENQIQSLKLDALCSVMVKAIQEQQEIINDLKARIETLETK